MKNDTYIQNVHLVFGNKIKHSSDTTGNYKAETTKLHYISIRPEWQETEKRYKVSKVL